MATASVAYRLRASGADEIKNSFREIAQSGDQSAKRVASAFDRDLKTAEGAVERLERRAKQLDALGGSNVQRFINGNTGAGNIDAGQYKQAEQSASALFREQDRLIRQKEVLIGQFDPLFAAQQRYNNVIDQASDLRRREIITEQQFVEVEKAAQVQILGMSDAHIRGAGSARQQSAAYQNLGYQIQDITQGFALGVNPLVILAQQGGQTASALSLGLGEAGTAGKVARFIAGPWGSLVIAGVSILGTLALKADETGDKMDEGKLSAEDFARGIDTTRMSAEEAAKSLANLNDVTADMISIQRDYIQSNLDVANSEKAKIDARIAALDVQIAQRERAKFSSTPLDPFSAYDDYQTGKLKEQRSALQRASGSAGDASTNAQMALTLRKIDEKFDERKKLDGEYQRALQVLVERREAYSKSPLSIGGGPSPLSQSGFDQEAESLRRTYERRQKEADAREQEQRRQEARFRRDRDSTKEKPVSAGDVKAVLQGLGGRITSGARTPAQNAAVDGAKNSYHLAGQAFDLGLVDAQGRRLSKEIIRDALTAAGVEIKELLGPGDKGHDDHFHVAFSTDRLSGDQRLESSLKVQAELEKAQQDFIDGNVAAYRTLTDMIDPAGAAMRKTAEDLAKIDALAKAGPANGGITAEQGTSMRLDVRSSGFMANLGDSLAGRQDSEGEQSKAEADYRKTVENIGDGQTEQLAQLDRELSLVTASADERDRQLDTMNFILDLKRQGIGADSTEGEALILGNQLLFERGQLLQDQAAQWQEVTQFGERMIDTVLDPQNWHDFGSLADSILKDIEREMLKLALINPLKNALFGGGAPTLFGGGGGGGAVGGILSIVGSIFGGAKGSAVGTENWGGGATWLAENGPELVQLPQGSKVTPAAQTRRMMENSNAGPATNLTYNIDATGADAAGLARVQAQLAEMKRDLPGTIIGTVSDAKQRFVI